LQLGSGQTSKIYSGTDTFKIDSVVPGGNFQVNVVPTGGSSTSAIFVNTNVGEVGIYTSTPQATLDVNGSAIIRGTLSLTGSSLTIGLSATKTGTSPGTTGQFAWDASYLYVCTATNTWKRVALTSF
jgi:hypothetical protein